MKGCNRPLWHLQSGRIYYYAWKERIRNFNILWNVSKKKRISQLNEETKILNSGLVVLDRTLKTRACAKMHQHSASFVWKNLAKK
jgi:hypothetical protein